MMSLRYHALMLLDRLMAAFESFAGEFIGSFTDELWNAIEDERPVWPEVIRWAQGLCGGCATPWPVPLLHRVMVRRCKWCREEI
jgi:hypothetical protein